MLKSVWLEFVNKIIFFLIHLLATVVVKKVGHEVTKDEIYKLVADHITEYKWLDCEIHSVNALNSSDKMIKNKVDLIVQTLYDKIFIKALKIWYKKNTYYFLLVIIFLFSLYFLFLLFYKKNLSTQKYSFFKN